MIFLALFKHYNNHNAVDIIGYSCHSKFSFGERELHRLIKVKFNRQLKLTNNYYFLDCHQILKNSYWDLDRNLCECKFYASPINRTCQCSQGLQEFGELCVKNSNCQWSTSKLSKIFHVFSVHLPNYSYPEE